MKLIIKGTQEASEDILHILMCLRGLEVITLKESRDFLHVQDSGQDLSFEVPEEKAMYFKNFLKAGHVYF
jgi:hypothetical protein